MAKNGSSSAQEQYTQSGSSSFSEYGSSTNSHSEGMSQTHSEGGSVGNSKTAGKSGSTTTTENKQEGGSSSQATGKSWASGTVDDTTLEHRQQLADYAQDQKVTDTYNRLQETIANRPTGFSSSWDQKLSDIYNQLVNGEKFSYDFNKDALYKLYSQQYQQRGKKAAKDVMGQAQAMSGGYSNSYAQSVANQQYNEYLKQLNDIIPELQRQAYQRYQQDRADKMNEFNMAQSLRGNEYQQYRDTVSDWQSDRSFDQSAYQDMRNYERQNFESDRAYWQQEYWNQRNAEQSNSQEQLASNWSDARGLSDTQAWNTSETNTSERHWDDSITTWSEDSVSNTSGWESNNSSNWSHTMATSATWPNAMGAAAASAGGGGGGGRSGGGYSSVSAEYPSNWTYSDNGRDLVGGGLKSLSQQQQSSLMSSVMDRLSQMAAPANATAEQKAQANDKQVTQLVNWIRQGTITEEEALQIANARGISFGGVSTNLMRTW